MIRVARQIRALVAAELFQPSGSRLAGRPVPRLFRKKKSEMPGFKFF